MTIHSEATSAGEILRFTDHIMIVRNSAHAGADAISIIEARAPYGAGPPLHVHHTQDEHFHILEGTMRFTVGGKEIVAHAGETLMAPKGVPHTFRVESPNGVRVLTVTRGAEFETMVREMSVPAVSLDVTGVWQPSPDEIGALAAACARNGIDIVGPPLGPKA